MTKRKVLLIYTVQLHKYSYCAHLCAEKLHSLPEQKELETKPQVSAAETVGSCGHSRRHNLSTQRGHFAPHVIVLPADHLQHRQPELVCREACCCWTAGEQAGRWHALTGMQRKATAASCRCVELSTSRSKC